MGFYFSYKRNIFFDTKMSIPTIKLTSPKISVIMSVYNGEKYLREAMESILNQTFTDFEFIIVNDGSADGSLDIIWSYGDDRISVIDNEHNIGLTKSLNKALRFAKGEYIARQDADDVSLPNRLERQLNYLEKHAEIAVLGTSVYLINENGKTITKTIALARPTLKDLHKGNQFAHGSVMFRKDIVAELGGYNELLKYVQDYELWLRIAKNYGIGNLTEPLYKLRFHTEKLGTAAGEIYPLYNILALRLATSTQVDHSMLKAIEDGDSWSAYHFLSKSEKAYFHKMVAGQHRLNNDMRLARKEYKKSLALNPWDILTVINLARSYFGQDIVIRISQIYYALTNFTRRIKNRDDK
jgi:glycosyltransferase involved in cell wall biosynthesis